MRHTLGKCRQNISVFAEMTGDGVTPCFLAFPSANRQEKSYFFGVFYACVEAGVGLGSMITALIDVKICKGAFCCLFGAA